MEKKQQQFPTEEVTLPSKGLLYPEGSPLKKGALEMKYMTAREEDILTNQNLIENGTVIDKLLQSLIITPINYDDLLLGDKNAILIAARILGYGKDYEFDHNGKPHIVDLTNINDKSLNESLITNGENKFYYTLPTTKVEVTFKLLTHGDEKAITAEIKGLKRLNKDSSSSVSTRMKHMITSVGGNSESKTIREFVDNQLLARDARELRNHIAEIQPDVDLTYEYEDKNGDFVKIGIPIGLNFFWPDTEL
tara:strand:+ start:4447 stop:5196 length:750 start_codon:yes stop_codon:yes gene_type:complete